MDPSSDEVLVVYEPAWAIGADSAADAEHVAAEVQRIKDLLHELGAGDPHVIYGGTVNDENIDQFARLDVLDGAGATRASLATQVRGHGGADRRIAAPTGDVKE